MNIEFIDMLLRNINQLKTLLKSIDIILWLYTIRFGDLNDIQKSYHLFIFHRLYVKTIRCQ